MKLLLIGEMGSGKDTVAEYLKDKYSFYPAKLGAFIRAHVDSMFVELTDDERRTHYQTYGEGMRELFGEDFWNERLWNHMDHSQKNIMITDCRQNHEVNYWVPKGFVPVAVDSDTAIRIKRLEQRDGANFNVDAFTHPTEMRAKQLINDVKSKRLEGHVLTNNESLDKLQYQIDNLMMELLVYRVQR